MKIAIEGTAKEIAVLALELQERQSRKSEAEDFERAIHRYANQALKDSGCRRRIVLNVEDIPEHKRKSVRLGG